MGFPVRGFPWGTANRPKHAGGAVSSETALLCGLGVKQQSVSYGCMLLFFGQQRRRTCSSKTLPREG